MDGYRAIAFPLFATDNRIITQQIRGDSGCHRPEGIFIGWGPGFRAGAEVPDAHITDLAPTILHAMGLPVPDDMDGRVLAGALSTDRPVEYQRAAAGERGEALGLSGDESAEVEERLRALGYLS
jgi:arylsulfatase A-like enzyme